MPNPVSKKRFTENTIADRLLKKLFVEGKIGPLDKAAVIRETEECFMQYDVKSFGDKFRAYENRYGRSTDPQARGVQPTIVPRATDNEEPKNAGPAALDGTPAIEILMHRLSFHPLSLNAPWNDRRNRMRQRLSVPVLLPSGIGTDDVEVTVCDDGGAFEIEVTWSRAMLDPEELLSVFINGEDYPSYAVYHVELLSIETVLKDLHKEADLKRSEPIKSKMRIQLPFQVVSNDKEAVAISTQSDSEKCPYSRVLLVRLFAVEDEYDDTNSSMRPKNEINKIDPFPFEDNIICNISAFT